MHWLDATHRRALTHWLVPAGWERVWADRSSSAAGSGLCLEVFVSRVLIMVDRSWRFDLGLANRGRWKRHQADRPRTTWEAAWATAFGVEWVSQATSPSFTDRAMQFAHSVHKACGFPSCELRYGPRTRSTSGCPVVGAEAVSSARLPRQVEAIDVEWRVEPRSHFQLEMLGDSLTVVRWLQGWWQCQHRELQGLQEQVLDVAGSLVSAGMRPRMPGAEFVRHVLREHNYEADALTSEIVA